ncbi:hypothetical protein ACF07Z_18535 [Streptomyces albidoflavus]
MDLFHRVQICLLGAIFAMVFVRPDEYPGAGAWEPDTALLAIPVVLHTGEGLVRAVWRRVRVRLGPGSVRLRDRRRPRAWPRVGTALVGVGRLSQVFGQGLICYLVYDVLKLWIELAALETVRLTWMSPGLVFDLWLTGALLSYAGQLLMRRGARLRVRVHGSPEAALRDADVLYLRPFTVDSSARQVPMGVPIVQLAAAPAFFQAPGLTAEERLVRSLGAVGTGVALGAPGERLPSAGCDRLYLPLAAWQPVVARLVDRARLTVLVVGDSPGSLWEFTQVVRSHPPQRIVLVLLGPPEVYQRFRRRVAHWYACQAPHWEGGTGAARLDLPADPEFARDQEPDRPLVIRGALTFDAQGTAREHVLDLRGYRGVGVIAQQMGLGHFLDELRESAQSGMDALGEDLRRRCARHPGQVLGWTPRPALLTETVMSLDRCPECAWYRRPRSTGTAGDGGLGRRPDHGSLKEERRMRGEYEALVAARDQHGGPG